MFALYTLLYLLGLVALAPRVVLDLLRGHRSGVTGPQFWSPDGGDRQPPCNQDPGNIGQRIPAQRELHPEERYGENFGRYLGKT